MIWMSILFGNVVLRIKIRAGLTSYISATSEKGGYPVSTQVVFNHFSPPKRLILPNADVALTNSKTLGMICRYQLLPCIQLGIPCLYPPS
jgi:hypothetical protein